VAASRILIDRLCQAFWCLGVDPSIGGSVSHPGSVSESEMGLQLDCTGFQALRFLQFALHRPKLQTRSRYTGDLRSLTYPRDTVLSSSSAMLLHLATIQTAVVNLCTGLLNGWVPKGAELRRRPGTDLASCHRGLQPTSNLACNINRRSDNAIPDQGSVRLHCLAHLVLAATCLSLNFRGDYPSGATRTLWTSLALLSPPV
jgi:hypothetical protein